VSSRIVSARPSYIWYVALAALLLTNVFTIVYSAARSAPQEVTDSGLIDPQRRFEKQENLIVNIQPLRDELSRYEADENISIYFEYLKTGANIAVQKDAQFWPASLLKLPVALGAVKMIEEGTWEWDDTITLLEEDRDGEYGALYKLPVGSKLSLEELLRRMLIESDNTAYRMLFRKVGAAQINEAYEHLGLKKFFTDDGQISAKRYSVLLRALYTSSYLEPENSERILSFLAESPFRDFLGSGFPASTRFAHKHGLNDERGVVLDAGIVYVPGRPYILTVMIRTQDLGYAQSVMQKISKLAYEYVTQYHAEENL